MLAEYHSEASRATSTGAVPSGSSALVGVEAASEEKEEIGQNTALTSLGLLLALLS